jgi:alcohol dehydrogenase class IV
MNNQTMMNIFLNQLKMKNPQMANQVINMINSGGNPYELFKQVTKGYTPEQANKFYEQAKQYGFDEELLKQVQNGNGI